MSFYGNILYELTNAFSSIVVKNSGSLATTFPIYDATDVTVPAVGLGGRFELDTGNKWIGLKGSPEGQSCVIFHKAIDTDDKTYSFQTLSKPANVTEAVELSSGDYLSGVKVTYDKAGHVTGSTVVNYKLPVSDTEKDVEDIKDRMDVIEGSDATQTQSINTLTSDFNILDGSVSTLSQQLGALDSRVGSQYELTVDSNMTLTKAIGNVDNLKNATAAENVCNSIIALQTSVNKQNAAITDVSLAQQVVIQRLCKQLRDANVIDIDEDALWAT